MHLIGLCLFMSISSNIVILLYTSNLRASVVSVEKDALMEWAAHMISIDNLGGSLVGLGIGTIHGYPIALKLVQVNILNHRHSTLHLQL